VILSRNALLLLFAPSLYLLDIQKKEFSGSPYDTTAAVGTGLCIHGEKRDFHNLNAERISSIQILYGEQENKLQSVLRHTRNTSLELYERVLICTVN
jgi:hypothetical protein